MTPDPRLDDIPWDQRPMLEIRRGRAEDADQVGITACFAGVAETGTLMLTSGPESPTRNNFLPDTHIVVMRGDQVVATYEEGWTRLREAKRSADGGVDLPRTVNFITGPSRTGDIEQRLELGAHGPRRLHIVLVDDGASS
jgi:L-lactate dehydrogenase complex protein LldG